MIPELMGLLVVLTLGVLSPGPDFLIVLHNSVGGSRRRALATVAGIVAGLWVQLTAIAIGFAALTADMVRALQIGAVVILVWLGLRVLWGARGKARGESRVNGSTVAGAAAFLQGLGCNLTNVKAFLFYVSMYTHLHQPGAPAWSRGVIILFFLGHAAVTWLLVVRAIQSPPIARRLARAQRWLPYAFGAALLVLAGWIAAELR